MTGRKATGRQTPVEPPHCEPGVRPVVAFVLKGYPRLSETFIAQEILGLERRGLDIRIVSLRQPTDPYRHPVHDEIAAPVAYLPEYLHQAPGRVLAGWRAARRLSGYKAARRAWLKDIKRDFSRNRVRRFGQALVLAAELAAEVGRLHAHFLHTPASVARYAAAMRGLPWSCSAHAKDVWTTPDWEKTEKLADLDWLVTCTAAGLDHLRRLAVNPERVRLVYHGLDLARFASPPGRKKAAHAQMPPTLLTIGRIVPKKGFDILLQALGRLRAMDWRLVHIGGGRPGELAAQAGRLGLGGRIEWRGPLAQTEVLQALRSADLFVLPCRIADDGDRDGLPNVLMEAQSQGLACISTTISGIPELIEHGRTGLLVEPDDAKALAGAIARLLGDPSLRASLGAAGLARLRASFGQEAGLDQLADMFGLGTKSGRARAAAAG